jgi:DUF4097 and DUF4098 domain-containing protein YvlB
VVKTAMKNLTTPWILLSRFRQVLIVMVSTINDGEISVENVKGVVQASNINGGIKLKNLMREAEASTINGDVDIEYAKNPVKGL